MGPFVNSVACLQKDHKKYPNLFCFVWLVNPEDSEKGLDIFWVWISEKIQTFGFLSPSLCICQHEPLAEGRERRERHASLPYAVYGAFRC